MIESLLVLVVLVVVAYLIVKNYHPALSLIIGALVLLACAWMLGHPIYPAGEGIVSLNFKKISNNPKPVPSPAG
jgi:DcuC family C4-dicarboxylate transporter